MIEPLTEANCPLVAVVDRARLAERFNRTLELCKLVESECNSATLARSTFAGVQKKLALLRASLSRQRYEVGFLGRFQSGKSTTFNNLLGIDVSQSGNTDPTTATVTRIQPIIEGEHHLLVHYLSEKDYQDKASEGRRSNEFDDSQTDNQILAEIPKRLADVEPTRRKNLEYLYLLLKSRLHFGERLGTEKEVGFADRARYLNHPTEHSWLDSAATPTPLLRDVVVRVRTSAIPTELEMVDLPGLGSTFSADDDLTKEYIEKLDGALIFVAPDTGLKDSSIQPLLQRLLSKNRECRGRVWLVVAKSDSLAGQLTAERTVFDVLKQNAADLNLPLEQICFVTNMPERLEALPRDLPVFSREDLAPLKHAWQVMFDGSGGGGRLGMILREEVADGLRAHIAAEAEKTVREIAKELFFIAQTDLGETGDLDVKLARVNAAINQISRLSLEVRRGRQWFTDLDVAGPLQVRLDGLRIVPDVLDQRSDFALQWRRGTARLQAALEHLVRSEAVDKAYKALLPELQKIDDDGDRPLQVPGCIEQGLSHAWEEYRREDRAAADWRKADFPSFLRNNPYANDGGDGAQPFDGREFLDLLREKTRVVNHQLSHALRSRLCDRLKKIDDYLSEYVQAGIERENYQKSAKLECELKGYEELCRGLGT